MREKSRHIRDHHHPDVYTAQTLAGTSRRLQSQPTKAAKSSTTQPSTRWSLRNVLPSPRNSPWPTGLPSAGRLWNPTNSTPRAPPPQADRTRPRKDSEPPEVIAIPLEHPDLAEARKEVDATGDYPLLTLPEQRQQRHSGGFRRSLQAERSGSSSGAAHRVSLPRSVSVSLEIARDGLPDTLVARRPTVPVNAQTGKDSEQDVEQGRNHQRQRGYSIKVPWTLAAGLTVPPTSRKMMMHGSEMDIERGPAGLAASPYHPSGIPSKPHNPSNASHASLHSISGAHLGSAISSTNTSIMGEQVNPDDDEWGPSHPCYPHLNPHLPRNSPLFKTTRIIRIRRDWMVEGDLAPTFSNLYPEILDPAGVSEQDFRRIVERINTALTEAFRPQRWRNVVDGVLGVLTGWVWDDIGAAGVKGQLVAVEKAIEEWNREMEIKMAASAAEPGMIPKILPLRRTGYLNVSPPPSVQAHMLNHN